MFRGAKKYRGYQSPASPKYRAGRRAPTLLQAGVVAIPGYFFTQFILNKADTFAADQYFDGSAALNNGRYPAILTGMAASLVMLQIVALASPTLFDRLYADKSWLRNFLYSLTERLSSLGRRRGYQELEGVAVGKYSLSPDPAIAFTDESEGVSYPSPRNGYNYFLRGMAVISLHVATFALVTVLPAGDAALRFGLAEYKGKTTDEVDAACYILSAVGIAVIPVIQFFVMLSANTIFSYCDTPRSFSGDATTLQRVDGFLNDLFGNMGVVRSIPEEGVGSADRSRRRRRFPNAVEMRESARSIARRKVAAACEAYNTIVLSEASAPQEFFAGITYSGAEVVTGTALDVARAEHEAVRRNRSMSVGANSASLLPLSPSPPSLTDRDGKFDSSGPSF